MHGILPQNTFVLAFHQCKKPCADIEYKIGKDSYLLGTPDENAVNSGCQAGEGVINFQFSKMWEFAKVLLQNHFRSFR